MFSSLLVRCKLAVENESDSVIMIDPFEILRRDEAGEPTYTRTVDAVRHFDHEINDVLGGIQTTDGDFVKARVMLLIGADLALTSEFFFCHIETLYQVHE